MVQSSVINCNKALKSPYSQALMDRLATLHTVHVYTHTASDMSLSLHNVTSLLQLSHQTSCALNESGVSELKWSTSGALKYCPLVTNYWGVYFIAGYDNYFCLICNERGLWYGIFTPENTRTSHSGLLFTPFVLRGQLRPLEVGGEYHPDETHYIFYG